MPTLTLSLPRPHAAQRRVLAEARRFNVLACGRRWGKSTLLEDRVLEPSLAGWPVGWFAPTYKILLPAWHNVSRVLAPVTAARNVQQRRIELVTGGIVEFWSLEDRDAGRSRKYKRAVVDEAGLVGTLAETWNAAIRPTLADLAGDAWLAGTPKGRNFFATAYDWGQDPAMPDWASWQMPTSSNPFIAPSEVEAMRTGMPERIFEQEVLAAFLDDAGGVFRRVRAAATSAEERRAKRRHEYVIGVDWGKHHDFTVLSVLNTTHRAQVAIERFNQIDYAVQMGRLKALAERFRPSLVIAESNSMGEPLIEQALREGLPVQPFQTTNASKAQAIEALALAFERADLRILPDPVQLAELQAYEAERLPSGLLRYGAPEGMHDDTVMALAMAWQAVSQYAVPNIW